MERRTKNPKITAKRENIRFVNRMARFQIYQWKYEVVNSAGLGTASVNEPAGEAFVLS